MREYTLFLKDIIGAMDAIENFVEGMTFDEFETDDKTSSAVLKKFENIGEAVKNIPKPILQKHTNIPWNKMAGLRDRLIHAYFGTDFEIIWEAVKETIPEIKPALKEIYKDEIQNSKL